MHSILLGGISWKLAGSRKCLPKWQNNKSGGHSQGLHTDSRFWRVPRSLKRINVLPRILPSDLDLLGPLVKAFLGLGSAIYPIVLIFWPSLSVLFALSCQIGFVDKGHATAVIFWWCSLCDSPFPLAFWIPWANVSFSYCCKCNFLLRSVFFSALPREVLQKDVLLFLNVLVDSHVKSRSLP